MLNAAKTGLIVTTYFSMSQGKNHYTVSSPNTYRKNLKKFHDKDIKRRCYFQHMRDLEDNRYIRRRQRYKNDDDGLIRQIPSMTTLLLKGVVLLVRMGTACAKKLYKSMVTFSQKEDKRWPSEEFKKDTSYRPADPEERKMLDDLCRIATKTLS